ncbi:DUF4132 domain-containing protein [Actinoalloteichus hymeniacidonis]|uniref:DUF4132 family protein n=1 Tax=Actinoalloteichus hymeniacidonis TaxID=340345 RepID=A0AAC9HQ54_9PSEU|nr:DUF4132 domain-containing protein [Actinoalloteichus hymeniacidonis]AOS63582.1 putative DUF4132 family protein [Actinoalloteichus hymeniacidonis]MBB5908372.1 hypothetical protein [Actinoalloteichus hymeniacidonis]
MLVASDGAALPAVVPPAAPSDPKARFRRECRETVRRWMVRSLPIPVTTLVRLFEDETWRDALSALVVVPVDERGALITRSAGLLRDIDADGAVLVVDAAGTVQTLTPERLAIAHPVLLSDLESFQELAVVLEIEQPVSQLFRQTEARPIVMSATATSLTDYADGHFVELGDALERCHTEGLTVRDGYVVCPIFERGRLIEAKYWIGAGSPDLPACTGELFWELPEGTRLRCSEVGPVAWSEGARMAAVVFAGRFGAEAGSVA